MSWSRTVCVLIVAALCLSSAVADSNGQLESLRNKFLASYQRSTQRVQSETLRLNREAQTSARGGIHETSLIQLRENLATAADASDKQSWAIVTHSAPVSVYRQTGDRSFANTHGSPKGRGNFITSENDDTRKAASEIETVFGPKPAPVYAPDATIVPFDSAAPPSKEMRTNVKILTKNGAPTYNAGDIVVRPTVENSEDLASSSQASIRLARMLAKGARSGSRRTMITHKATARILDPTAAAPAPSSDPLTVHAFSIEPDFANAQVVQRRAYFDVDDASAVVATPAVAAPAVAAVLGSSPLDHQIRSILTQ